MQEKSGAWPNGQTPLCLQSESRFLNLLFLTLSKNLSTLFYKIINDQVYVLLVESVLSVSRSEGTL